MQLIRAFGATVQRHSQGLLFMIVLLLGASSVALGTASLRRSIVAPFALRQDDRTSLASAEALTKDTDSDGLFDADELSTYGTSPYLADSDSDGTSDSEELTAGTDPNCPTGQTCGSETESQGGEAAATFNSLTPLSSAAPTAAELRELLKQAGVPASQVDALSDEEILEEYRAVAASSAPPPPSPPSGNLEAAADLPPDQIRTLLLQGGLTEKDLEGVSDEDLVRVYRQTIDDLKRQQESSPPSP